MFTEVAMQKSQKQIKETLLKRSILYYLYLMVLQCYQKVILQYNYTTGILLNSMIKALLVYSVHNESVLAMMSVEEVHSGYAAFL